MDIAVAILMMILVGLQIVREVLGLYRDSRDADDGGEDADAGK